MTINYQSILAQIKGLLQGLFITNVPLVEQTALAYLTSTETRLATLAAAALTGDLSKEDVSMALKAEEDIFLSELNSFEEMGLSLAQGAINSVQGVITGILSGPINVVGLDDDGGVSDPNHPPPPPKP